MSTGQRPSSASTAGVTHREMAVPEVEALLSWPSNERSVSASTHRQALSALLFLYQQVYGLRLPWMQVIGRPPRKPRLPVVLSVAEVARVLALLGHSEVSTTMIYTHVLTIAAGGTRSPLDALCARSVVPEALTSPTWPPPEPLRPGAVSDPLPCFRVTPSCTAAATSAS